MSEPEIIKFIQKSYEQLKSQKDLSPRNETVNQTLNQLVLRLIEQNTCSSDFCNRLLGSRALKKIVERIRKISYKAECEMEKFWAERFVASRISSISQLSAFWYFKQYLQITQNEYELVKNLSDVKKVAFAGSGSLPMTAILLRQMGGYEIDLIDRDAKALDISRRLCSNLGISMNFICSVAEEVCYQKYDAVFVASMIEEKVPLIDKLRQDGIKFLIVRDAEKFSQLFYQKLEPEIFSRYKIRSYMPGDNLTLNSSLLLEVQ